MNGQQLPVVLMILDGWGIGQQTEGNAIARSNTENMDRLLAGCGHSQLNCSGEYVGLPEAAAGLFCGKRVALWVESGVR